MQRNMLMAKIHRATVTHADLHYEGSIAIDQDLLDASGILPFQEVDIYNVNNGERFSTYAIKGPRGTGTIGVNGAAARRVAPGDLLIICAYVRMEEAEAQSHHPSLVYVNEDNSIKQVADEIQGQTGPVAA
ncbi:MAG: aspartate 1-decarboxylase [Alphaproteobacteria bacterium CG_4_10_14_0_2_um_filter_63_37]|nr:MAG: aspartate 1-decarboxylase [Proteobacteria bacterium CG1_02_64_396]PJA23801.1 MAG: aspartate 1-decarboxylase [Alphaproteobacteria bacterium CG_4_10_14_0_2_um_filter_63_37]